MENKNKSEEQDEDERFFERVLSDVEPLKTKLADQKNRKPTVALISEPFEKLSKPVRIEPKNLKLEDLQPLSLEEFPTGRAPGIDRTTSKKLVSGKMAIQGRLDLHGMSQQAARVALERFIKNAYKLQKRVLLVITGKGRHSETKEFGPDRPMPGVLRQRVPAWLLEQPLRGWVLAFTPAQPAHGGMGAIYVLLRKKSGK